MENQTPAQNSGVPNDTAWLYYMCLDFDQAYLFS